MIPNVDIEGSLCVRYKSSGRSPVTLLHGYAYDFLTSFEL